VSARTFHGAKRSSSRSQRQSVQITTGTPQPKTLRACQGRSLAIGAGGHTALHLPGSVIEPRDSTAFIAAIGAWFAVRFIGSYTRSALSYVEGLIRWHNRVVGDAFTLAIDECSPFALGP